MRKLIKSLSLCGLMLTATPLIAVAALPALPMNANGQQVQSLAPMLQNIMPCIVNITTQGRFDVNDDPFRDPPQQRVNNDDAEPHGKRFENIGSGVIVDAKNGYILTNAHLTDQARLITVTLNDGRRYRAKLIGQDAASDIAVLQIHAPNLMAMSLADSNKVQVGDFVVAIGSPYGLNQTVTSGVVSATGRNDLGIEGFEDFIQTDASINPGNSGGALVDLQGHLIGINTAILAPNGGNIGIGFAIPSDMAYAIMEQLVKYGSVGRGVAGIMMQSLTPELANAMGEPNTKGALISQVTKNSPADKAGLIAGDVIIKINDTSVTTAGQVKNTIGLLRAGSKVNLTLLRNNKAINTTLVTADPKVFDQQKRSANPYLYGLAMRDFNAQVPNFGLVQGVQILHLNDSTPAWQAGLRAGDVIISANQHPVRSIEQLAQIAQATHNELLLNIYRDNGAAFFVIQG